MKNNQIGIFDSGIGGLTVAKEIIDLLPEESVIYLGDTARVPYGTRGKEIIKQFAEELAGYLLKKDVKLLVVACNTISATCLDEIQKISPVPVIGVIKPASLEVTQRTKTKKVGVIGTRATIGSGAYTKEIKNIDSSIEVVSQACPLFVPIAEEGWGNHKVAQVAADEYLSVFNGTEIDTLVLGCTHYPLLKDTIQQSIGKNVLIIDSAIPTTNEVKKVLKENNLLSDKKTQENIFLVTDAPQRVYEISSLFFGKEVFPQIQKVTI